jgi:hypothetical protein
VTHYLHNARTAEIAKELGIRPDLIRHMERDGHEYIRPMYGTLGDLQQLRIQALVAGFVAGPDNRPADGPRYPRHFARRMGEEEIRARTKWVELAHGYKPDAEHDLRQWRCDERPDEGPWLDTADLRDAVVQYIGPSTADYDLAVWHGRAIAIYSYSSEDGGTEREERAGWIIPPGLVYVNTLGVSFEVVERRQVLQRQTKEARAKVRRLTAQAAGWACPPE